MAEDRKTLVVVKDLNKSFHLPHEQVGGIKQLVTGVFRRDKGYETQKVLDNINFDIKEGEFFGIIGRNGSGKSTLLKILAGIYPADEGSVEIRESLTPFIELGVGFNPDLTGRENIFLNGALLGFSRNEMKGMYDEIVGFAELESFMDQKLRNYSSGMQVRLAFSIAIKANTGILLFDEVLAVGDENFQKKCLKTFRDLKKAGKTIILVSHNTDDVEKFCDRVLVLDKSKQLGIFNARDGVSLYQELNNEQAREAAQKSAIPKKRWGTKNVKIESVTVKNAKAVTVDTGITVDFELSRSIVLDEKLPIKVGLAFYDEEGTNLSGPNSYKQDIHFPSNSDTMKITYQTKDVPFNRGLYKVTVAVLSMDESETYDHWVDATSFNIKTDDRYYGKILLDGKWEAKEK